MCYSYDWVDSLVHAALPTTTIVNLPAPARVKNEIAMRGRSPTVRHLPAAWAQEAGAPLWVVGLIERGAVLLVGNDSACVSLWHRDTDHSNAAHEQTAQTSEPWELYSRALQTRFQTLWRPQGCACATVPLNDRRARSVPGTNTTVNRGV
jgi:hypothetical protein